VGVEGKGESVSCRGGMLKEEKSTGTRGRGLATIIQVKREKKGRGDRWEILLPRQMLGKGE